MVERDRERLYFGPWTLMDLDPALFPGFFDFLNWYMYTLLFPLPTLNHCTLSSHTHNFKKVLKKQKKSFSGPRPGYTGTGLKYLTRWHLVILASSWASMANPMPDNCQEPGWPKTGVSTWRQAGEQLTWEETFFPHLHRDAHRGLAYFLICSAE